MGQQEQNKTQNSEIWLEFSLPYLIYGQEREMQPPACHVART